jgi:hypothetical protein
MASVQLSVCWWVLKRVKAIPRFLVVLCVACGITASCSAGGEGGGEVIVRDTIISHARRDVTVRIVENPADPLSLEQWTIGAEPLVDLGGHDVPEEEALFRVESAYRMRDGRIIVADGGSTSLKIFGEAGMLLRSIGRSGDGPGEFRGINQFERLTGDSLAVWDFAQARLTVFDADGNVGREVRIGATEASPMSDIIGTFDDGTLLTRDFVRLAETPSGLVRHDVGAFHLDVNGNVLDTIPPIHSGEIWFVPRNGGFSVFSVPMPRTTDIVAHGSSILVGDTDRAEIRVLSASGEPRMLVRWHSRPRAITEPDIASARAQALAEESSESERTEVERMFAQIDMPPTMPAFGALRVDTAGNLWVMDYRTDWDEGDVSWSVFDPDGAMIAHLSMPGGFMPTHIGDDFVLGIATDELDVEHVKLYRLTRHG